MQHYKDDTLKFALIGVEIVRQRILAQLQPKPRRRRHMSAESRKRIANAQRARWALYHARKKAEAERGTRTRPTSRRAA
jgi:hypothetical protein